MVPYSSKIGVDLKDQCYYVVSCEIVKNKLLKCTIFGIWTSRSFRKIAFTHDVIINDDLFVKHSANNVSILSGFTNASVSLQASALHSGPIGDTPWSAPFTAYKTKNKNVHRLNALHYFFKICNKLSKFNYWKYYWLPKVGTGQTGEVACTKNFLWQFSFLLCPAGKR